MGKLRGQVVVITGGSRGIGAAIAERCGFVGATVCLIARSQDDLETTVHRMPNRGGDAAAYAADVTDVSAVDSVFTKIIGEHGRIDLLINGAGRLKAIGPTWEMEPRQWWQDVSVNLYGAMLCCRRVIPAMLEQGAGRIVNIVGGGTASPFEFGSAYGCSKAALMRLTETLALELADTNVHVFAVNPGLVRTHMTQQFLRTKPGRRWMHRLADRLREGGDVSPDCAARLVVEIGAGRCDVLRGRYLNAPEDVDALDALNHQVPEPLQGDKRMLRVI